MGTCWSSRRAPRAPAPAQRKGPRGDRFNDKRRSKTRVENESYSKELQATAFDLGTEKDFLGQT